MSPKPTNQDHSTATTTSSTQPKPERMTYTPQSPTTTSPSKTDKPRTLAQKAGGIMDTILLIACAPCAFCGVACACLCLGDECTFLDGPFCKDCVPDCVQEWWRGVWYGLTGKERRGG